MHSIVDELARCPIKATGAVTATVKLKQDAG
jgi:hypothetical protein